MQPVNGVACIAGHWHLRRDAEDLAWLTLDCVGASVNTLSAAVLVQLADSLDQLEREAPRGLIVTSGKESGFIAGADVREFDQLSEANDIVRHVEDVHRLFARLEALSFPSVARVHGFCLGGGLELALACRHVVAADEPGTRIGFPEVLLGIHPGFGGTVRALRDCGASVALDLMLTGRALDARRARQAGLIDRAVPRRLLDDAARYFATNRVTRRRPPWTKRLSLRAPLRAAIAHVARKEVAKRASPAHYPAPYAVLALYREHGGNPAALYAAEARSVAHLVTGATSRNLVRLFRLQESARSGGRERAQAWRVHVIGAGTMGGDIAAWCALRGCQVTLTDRAPRYIAPAMRRAHELFARRLREPHLRLATRDRLTADFNGDGVGRADVIIEAIIEDCAAKRALFADLERRARPDALLATNTSSIRLEDIAAELRQPERLVGIHFFNPVAQMQLVEIVAAAATAAAVKARAAAFVCAIDRLPLAVASAPGFLVNRVLSPYLQEAMLLLEEGVLAADIDAVAREFGMPMGPLELADTVGLDICLHVGTILAGAFGGEVPKVLRQKVEQGHLGRKSDAGFYAYRRGRLQRGPSGRLSIARHELRDRLVLRLVNEAVACVRESIVGDADLLDFGMVFGTGFAPFRGGPLHYARERGVAEVRAALSTLSTACGPRFTPDPGWEQLT